MRAFRTQFRLFLTLFLVSTAQAAPGDFDKTFGQDGIFRLPNATMNRELSNFVTTTADGKVLVTGEYITTRIAGEFTTVDSTGDILVRLQANGQLDPTFASNGFGRSAFNPVMDTSGIAVFPLTDGRIIQVQTRWGLICSQLPGRVPCGTGQVSAHLPNFYAQRFEANGAIDPNYGIFGSATIGGEYNDVFADTSGAMTLFGRISVPDSRTQVLSYGANGLLVPAGYYLNATNALSRCLTSPQAITQQMRAQRTADGKTYVIQYVYDSSKQPGDVSSLCIVRLQSDGTLDGAWGNAGVANITDAALRLPVFQSVGLALRSDGSLQLVVNIASGIPRADDTSTIIFALNGAGAKDTTWGVDGTLRLSQDLMGKSAAVVAQSDGKLLVSGYPFGISSFFPPPDADRRPRLLRLNANGQPDLSFGSSGKGYAFIESAGKGVSPIHIHLAGDGNIFVAGAGYDLNAASGTPSQLAVAKLLAAEPPPAPSSPAPGGGGGCGSITTRIPPDPTIPGIALLAALSLAIKRRSQQKRADQIH